MTRDTLDAAARVIAARMAILAAAAADPAKADLMEIRLMATEKAEALAASGAAVAEHVAAEGANLGRSMIDDAGHALDAAQRMAGARSIAEVMAIQTEWATGLWGRASARAVMLNTAALEAQRAAFEPIRKAAMDNDARLKP